MILFKKILFYLSALIFNNTKSKVIYYHDVHDNVIYTSMSTPIELFKKHIEIIKKTYDIVDNIKNTNKQIVICFDDGFRGIYDNKDYFIKEDINVIIFLISSFINNENYLTESEIIELNKFTNFKFGAHTHSHINLGPLKKKEIIKEINLCKDELERILEEPVEHLCFPRGSFSENVIDLSIVSGYKYLYSSIPGNFNGKIKKDIIHRNLVQQDTPEMLKLSLKGAQNILRKKRLKQHFHKL